MDFQGLSGSGLRVVALAVGKREQRGLGSLILFPSSASAIPVAIQVTRFVLEEIREIGKETESYLIINPLEVHPWSCP